MPCRAFWPARERWSAYTRIYMPLARCGAFSTLNPDWPRLDFGDGSREGPPRFPRTRSGLSPRWGLSTIGGGDARARLGRQPPRIFGRAASSAGGLFV